MELQTAKDLRDTLGKIYGDLDLLCSPGYDQQLSGIAHVLENVFESAVCNEQNMQGIQTSN